MKYIVLIFLSLAFTKCDNFFSIDDSIDLPKKVSETSGITLLKDKILTFNDSGGKPELYLINPKSGKIKKSIKIKGAKNIDWESITEDDKYIYIGDTGNNDGDRDNLVIYKIKKLKLESKHAVRAEKIHFSYEDQKEFKSSGHNHNFDCESITIYKNKILIFTKNWKNFKTNIYSIPKNKGSYIAKKEQTIDINCLLTSVDYNEKTNALVGTAYDKDYKSYLILFKDFSLTNKNFSKLELTPKLGYVNQIEAVTWKDKNNIYITREASVKKIDHTKFSNKQKLMLISFKKAKIL